MRLYSEKEIGAILKRTAELSKPSDIPNADGLSLDELKQLAAEAGLNPDLVARAAAELSPRPSMVDKPDMFGGPLSHSIELSLDVEINQDTWENMLPTIRAHFKDPGIVQTRPGAFEWTGTGGFEMLGKTHVSVQKSNGGSRMHIFWSETTSAVPFFIPTMLSLVLTPAILFEELGMGPEGIPIWITIVATAFFLSRSGVAAMKKRRVQKLDMLAQDLTQIMLQDTLAGRAERSPTASAESETAEPVQTSMPSSVPAPEADSRPPVLPLPDDEPDSPDHTDRIKQERDRI